MGFAVYRFFDGIGTLLYVGCSCNMMTRMVDHSQKRRFGAVETIKVAWYSRQADARAEEVRAIIAEKPEWNIHNGTSHTPICSLCGMPKGKIKTQYGRQYLICGPCTKAYGKKYYREVVIRS